MSDRISDIKDAKALLDIVRDADRDAADQTLHRDFRRAAEAAGREAREAIKNL